MNTMLLLPGEQPLQEEPLQHLCSRYTMARGSICLFGAPSERGEGKSLQRSLVSGLGLLAGQTDLLSPGTCRLCSEFSKHFFFFFFFMGSFRIKCLKFFFPWWSSFICPISLKIENAWTKSGRAINPAHIQYDIKVVILWGILDVGPKLYFWQDLHQNRLSTAVSKAWMTAGGLAAQQHDWWLWTM